MKATYTLNRTELSQAVADYVSKQAGKSLEVNVRFNISADYDFADRPTGAHTITAIADIVEGKR